jgi:hypothetical protein
MRRVASFSLRSKAAERESERERARERERESERAREREREREYTGAAQHRAQDRALRNGRVIVRRGVHPLTYADVC